jgi:hypothetical protein
MHATILVQLSAATFSGKARQREHGAPLDDAEPCASLAVSRERSSMRAKKRVSVASARRAACMGHSVTRRMLRRARPEPRSDGTHACPPPPSGEASPAPARHCRPRTRRWCGGASRRRLHPPRAPETGGARGEIRARCVSIVKACGFHVWTPTRGAASHSCPGAALGQRAAEDHIRAWHRGPPRVYASLAVSDEQDTAVIPPRSP